MAHANHFIPSASSKTTSQASKRGSKHPTNTARSSQSEQWRTHRTNPLDVPQAKPTAKSPTKGMKFNDEIGRVVRCV